MEPTTGSNPDEIRAAASATASPDPETADLLAKHAMGQKLDARGYGIIGAYARKTKNWLFGKGGTDPKPAMSAAPGGHPTALAPAAPAEASGDRLAAVQVDAGVARRVAEALITRGDAACANWIERHATRAGAVDERLDRCRTAARLTPNDRALIVDLSPEVFAELGIDPKKSPLVTVSAVLGLHALNLWQIVDELKELAKERQASEPKPVAGSDRTISPAPTAPAGPASTNPPGLPVEPPAQP